MEEIKYPLTHEWHVSINKHSDASGDHKSMRFMYEAKDMAMEVPRAVMLFRHERLGTLPQEHQQCSRHDPEPIQNVLTCCLGVKCAECPHLKSLEGTARCTPEEIDTIKAWTCAAHIAMSGGDMANEGYILTTSDRIFWDRTHESLIAGMDDPNT